MNFDLVGPFKKQKTITTKNINLLTKRAGETPFTMSENENSYSLFLIVSGIDKKDIFLDVNNNKNEVSVYIAKKNQYRHEATFWVFAVPLDGMLNQIKMQYRQSGVEITIPKKFLSVVAS